MSTKGERTKAAIQTGALSLFVQKGFKDVTMQDICEITGLSRGGLYAHYGSTKEIFSAIIEELMSGLQNEVSLKLEQGLSATSILDEILERYQTELLDKSGSLGLAFYEYYSSIPLSHENPLLKQYYNAREMLCTLLQYGIDTGEFRQITIKPIVDLLLFSYQGIRMLSTIMPLDDDSISIGMIQEIRNRIVK